MIIQYPKNMQHFCPNMLVFIFDKYSSTCMFSSCLPWAELMCSLSHRKGTKSKQGAGHVWVLADEARDEATVGYLLDLGGGGGGMLPAP
jgi:hypothetical protein